MKIINPGIEIITPIDPFEILKHIELCGRVCYKSEEKITDESCVPFVRSLIQRGHEAVLEHYNITVRFTVDRGISHEIVRHRLASYCQESTRYCDYSKGSFGSEITVIKPCGIKEGTVAYGCWERAMCDAEESYRAMLQFGCTPQEARSVLPNSLKTEVIMTANLREWRHFCKLRCSPAAHPDMQRVAKVLCKGFQTMIPVIFDDCMTERVQE